MVDCSCILRSDRIEFSPPTLTNLCHTRLILTNNELGFLNALQLRGSLANISNINLQQYIFYN